MTAFEPLAAIDCNHQQWLARLHMSFATRQGRTLLHRTKRQGPLSVQRAFYPETNGTAHLYLLHPPAGIVSGDELRISASLSADNQVLLTTPGANRFYRARGASSPASRQSQYTHFSAAQNACLEYLPHETLVYAQSNAFSHTDIHLQDEASYIGWEIACLGLPHIQQPFNGGQFTQTLSVYYNQRIRFHDRLAITANDDLCTARIGLAGHHVTGTMVMVNGQSVSSQQYADTLCTRVLDITVKEQQHGLLAVTQVQGVVIVRYLGDNSEQCRECFHRIWAALRPEVSQREAVSPRIWFT